MTIRLNTLKKICRKWYGVVYDTNNKIHKTQVYEGNDGVKRSSYDCFTYLDKEYPCWRDCVKYWNN